MSKGKYIWRSCVGDPYISNEIRKMAVLKTGASTAKTEKTVLLSELVAPMHRMRLH